jgi:hypothetical protein
MEDTYLILNIVTFLMLEDNSYSHLNYYRGLGVFQLLVHDKVNVDVEEDNENSLHWEVGMVLTLELRMVHVENK